MKIHSVQTDDGPRTAIASGDRLVGPPRSSGLAEIPAFAPCAEPGRDVGPLAGAHLGVPLRPGKILAIGLNYRDHAAEAKLDLPERPLIMSKLTSSLIGPGGAIQFDPSLTSRVDWEVELAFVIARRSRHVSEATALEHVAGYTVSNDVSARDLQWDDGQWLRCKSLDSFCPVGPCVITADEIADPQSLDLMCRVNGEEVQRSNTRQMVFGVAELVSYLSRNFTLEPGDLIMTGTPWGVGEFMEPRRSLHDGDVLESEVEGLGVLTNTVEEVGAFGSDDRG